MQCEVGEAHPAANGLEEDKVEEHSEGTSGRAEEGAGLRDGRVQRESTNVFLHVRDNDYI